MPTRTEHIPCPTCAVPRPIVVLKWADRVRAKKRECRKCAAAHRRGPGTAPVTMVPCARCGEPRPIRTTDTKSIKAAANRQCRPCANETMPRVTTHQEPDDLVVEFLIAGTKVKANAAERLAAVAVLTDRRLTAAAIATRLHCTTRTVERHRAKLNAA